MKIMYFLSSTHKRQFGYEISSMVRPEERHLFDTLRYVHTLYRKVTSSKTFRFETHAGFIRLLMKGIFDSYAL